MMAAFSIFRFALAHKLSRHAMPLAHQSRHLHPPHPLSFDSSSPVSLFEFVVALGWLPQNKPVGEQGLAKLFTSVGILIEEYAQLSCANGRDNLFHSSQKSLSRFIYTLQGISHLLEAKVKAFINHCKFLSLMLTLIVWTGPYKIPWQTRWLEMKDLTVIALVWWWEQNKYWQKISLADNHCPSFLVSPSISLHLDTPYAVIELV